MKKRTQAMLLALAVALSTLAGVTIAAQPAAADTRYERVLVETTCGYVTTMAKVQSPEQAAAGTYTLKPTLVYRCERKYESRPYRHSHWYHALCPFTTGKPSGASVGLCWLTAHHI